MTTRWRPDLGTILVDEALTLVAAWKTRDAVDGGKINMTGDVASAMRDACRETIEDIGELEMVGYEPDAELAREECMAVPASVVSEDTSSVRELLDRASGLPLLSAGQLPDRRLWFYAVVVGDSPGHRTGFIRKTNPYKSVQPGKFFTTLGETLSRIEDPVFILEERFDLVLLPDGLVVLSQNAFELMFREVPALQARIPRWIQDITAKLPIDGDGADRLAEACRRDSRLLKRLRSIHERGIFQKVSIARVKQEIARQGLDESRLVLGNKLVFDAADRYTLLQLLNEDLFIGGLTDTPYKVDRKSTR